jgi:hypothetical protein
MVLYLLMYLPFRRKVKVQKFIAVTIHDVTGNTLEETKDIAETLNSIGVTNMSLLVIPSPHSGLPIEESPGLVSWLRHRQALGDEVVIHGLTHFIDSPKGIIGRYYARGVGEFQHLSYAAARARLDQANKAFVDIGFEPKGFVAPAWLTSKGTKDAILDMGFYYTSHMGICSPGRAFVLSPVIVFGARNQATALVSSGLADIMSHVLRNASCLRVALHPPDLSRQRVFYKAIDIIKQALECRKATTYKDFLSFSATIDMVNPRRREGDVCE